MKYIIGLLFCTCAQASILNIDTSKGYNLNGVSIGHVASVASRSLSLMSIGTATKRMGIAKIKLFVIQTYAENTDRFIRTNEGATKSINDVGLAAIRMTFLRSLDEVMVQDAITEYLNSTISIQEMPQYKDDVLAIVNAIKSQDTMYADDSISIICNRNIIQYENSAGNVFNINSVNKDLTTRIFSMFLGNPEDKDGIELKEQMLLNPFTILEQ